MIPIKYDNTTNGWVVADKENNNNDWYDYSITAKKWANICTVSSQHENYRTASIGTPIPIEDITTMFVWVPRYAYSIVNGYKTPNTDTPDVTNANTEKNININFLVGNTNKDVNGVEYPINYNASTDVKNGKTPMIVHPGFKFGYKEVPGLWIAKFEASGLDGEGNFVGNHVEGSKTEITVPTENTYVRILPNVISWRNIAVGDMQYVCMRMSNNSNAYGWNNVNSHLMKNIEWGIASYLCYSQYGILPMPNGTGKYHETNKIYYDMYTGAGSNVLAENGYFDYSSEYAYNTENGVQSSSTGNVYGIYDLAGGAHERMATIFDNGNTNLGIYGNPTLNENIKYFDEENHLNSEYSACWEAYPVSDEERNNRIVVEGIEGEEDEILSQSDINKKTFKNTESNIRYNVARKRLTDANYNLLENVKGIGLNETSTGTSYRGVKPNGGYGWIINLDDEDVNYEYTWNNDIITLGHGVTPFFVRGSGFCVVPITSVLYYGFINGGPVQYGGFRPVICP